jgi:hypothetical protein
MKLRDFARVQNYAEPTQCPLEACSNPGLAHSALRLKRGPPGGLVTVSPYD